MTKTTIVTGIGAVVMAILAAYFFYGMAQPAMAMGEVPTAGGITAIAVSLLGACGLSITSIVSWLTGGRITKSSPELLASLVAWLANQSDKQLERRFVVALLSTMDELFSDNEAIRKIISTLGAAIVSQWLPGPASESEVAK